MSKKIYLGDTGEELLIAYRKLLVTPKDGVVWEIALLVLRLLSEANLAIAEQD